MHSSRLDHQLQRVRSRPAVGSALIGPERLHVGSLASDVRDAGPGHGIAQARAAQGQHADDLIRVDPDGRARQRPRCVERAAAHQQPALGCPGATRAVHAKVGGARGRLVLDTQRDGSATPGRGSPVLRDTGGQHVQQGQHAVTAPTHEHALRRAFCDGIAGVAACTRDIQALCDAAEEC